METATARTTGDEVVLVKNFGWRLFDCIPICCGNASDGKRIGPWAFFRDDVTMDKIQQRLTDYAARKSKTASDLTYHNYDSVMINIPLTGIPLPIPYVICYREIQLSGSLK